MDTTEQAPETTAEPAPEAAPETAPEAPEAPDGAEDAAEDALGKGRASREAAKYRTQLRETEARLADATAKLEALQLEVARDLAERHGLIDGRELDRPVSELVTDEGLIDPEKVRAAVQELIKSKPYLGKSLPPTMPVSGSGAEHEFGTDLTWARFLNG